MRVTASDARFLFLIAFFANVAWTNFFALQFFAQSLSLSLLSTSSLIIYFFSFLERRTTVTRTVTFDTSLYNCNWSAVVEQGGGDCECMCVCESAVHATWHFSALRVWLEVFVFVIVDCTALWVVHITNCEYEFSGFCGTTSNLKHEWTENYVSFGYWNMLSSLILHLMNEN